MQILNTVSFNSWLLLTIFGLNSDFYAFSSCKIFLKSFFLQHFKLWFWVLTQKIPGIAVNIQLLRGVSFKFCLLRPRKGIRKELSFRYHLLPAKGLLSISWSSYECVSFFCRWSIMIFSFRFLLNLLIWPLESSSKNIPILRSKKYHGFLKLYQALGNFVISLITFFKFSTLLLLVSGITIWLMEAFHLQLLCDA